MRPSVATGDIPDPCEVSVVNVRSIFRPTVVSVDGDEPLVAVAERMQNEQVGSVVVMVGGRFAGILTERDLTRAVAEGADPKVDTARDYMTEAPAAVRLDADVHEVASTMFEYECRHLPVVSDRGGQVIGMVSIRDLLGTAIRLVGRA
jgi:CBS domain-containing protein